MAHLPRVPLALRLLLICLLVVIAPTAAEARIVRDAHRAAHSRPTSHPALLATGGTCVMTADLTTCTFSFTGVADSFTVPVGLTYLDVIATGGGGGGGSGVSDGFIGAPGGAGAVVTARSVPVTPGPAIPLFVGGGGGGGLAGGGGGSSDVHPPGVGDRSAEALQIIAGGGGGGAGNHVIGFGGTGAGTPGSPLTGAGGDGGRGVTEAHRNPTGGSGGTGGSPDQKDPTLSGEAGGAGAGGAGGAGASYPASGAPGIGAPLGFAGDDLMNGRGRGGAALQPAIVRATEVGGGGGGGYGGGGGGYFSSGGGAGGSIGPYDVLADYAPATYAPATNGGVGGAGVVLGTNGGNGSIVITFARRSGGAITFTSTAPTEGRIGTTYAPAATGAASGVPVRFAVSAGSAGICSAAGGVISFVAAGTCDVVASQEASLVFRAGTTATQSIHVTRSSTTDAPAPGATSTSTLKVSTMTTGTAIVTTFTAPGPGDASQTGTAAAAKSMRAKGIKVCTTTKKVKKAGKVTLTCTLTKAAKAARRKGSLTVQLTTTFTPTSGPKAVSTKTIKLARK